MSKFNLDAFLKKLCKTYPYLSSLGDLLEKARFTKLFNKSGDFTFIAPNKTKFTKISAKTGKNLRKCLLKIFVPGSYKTDASWPEIVNLKEGTVKAERKNNRLMISDSIIEYEGTMKGIPVWKSVRTVSGGAFNKDTSASEMTTISPENWNFIENLGLENVVAILYGRLDKENKKIADCFINGHPLAELFLIFDSPFITLDSRELSEGDKPEESYADICKKTGEYLVNNTSDPERAAALMKFLDQSTIVNDNIVEYHAMLEKNEKWEGFTIVHEKLRPYFVRVSLFVAILSEIENQMGEDSYGQYARAFAINASSDLKTTYDQFIQSEDVQTVIEKLLNIHALSGHILFKSLKTGSAQKPKPRKKITLRSADRKKITSSSSHN